MCPERRVSSLIRTISSTAQSHKLLSQTTIDPGAAQQLPSCSAASEQPIIVRQTLLDDTKDGGGISEPSGQRPRTP